MPLYIEKSKALIESVINLISKISFDPITLTIPSLLRLELTSIKAQSGIIASFEHIIKTALLSKLFQSKFFTFSLKSFSNRYNSSFNQGFKSNEILSVLMMLGIYALLISFNVSVQLVIVLFGTFVMITMALVIYRHKKNQEEYDSLHLIGEEKHPH